MLTNEDIKRIKKDPEIRIKELENSLSIALEINNKYQRENALLLRNRPLDTMDEVAYRELQAENEELKAELARAKEDHQYDNLVHQKELKEKIK
jgi:hypothetical protein